MLKGVGDYNNGRRLPALDYFMKMKKSGIDLRG